MSCDGAACTAPNATPTQKLAFARDAGAFPLWGRFGSGCIEKIDGVMALEIRHAWDYGDVPEGTAPTILGIHYAESPHHTPTRRLPNTSDKSKVTDTVTLRHA